MNLKGKVFQVLPEQTGTGKNGEWKKQEVIIETEGQYPKKVCISLWGEKVGAINIGTSVDVQLDAESREYNGRWYTELKAWKIESVGGTTQPSSPAPSAAQESSDDLPF